MSISKFKPTLYFSWAVVVSVWLFAPALGGKKKRTYNFNELARVTEKIAEDFTILDSIYQLEGLASCPEFYDYEQLKLKQEAFCYELEVFADLKDGKQEIITYAGDCIIENRKMVFRKRTSKELFAEKIAPVDTMARQLQKEANSYLRKIKNTCLRAYNKCRDSKREEGNQRALAYIKELMELRDLPEEILWQDSVALLQKLQNYKNYTQSVLVNELYNNLFLAYSEDLKHLIYHREINRYCANAHLRWTTAYEYYVREDFPCESVHIEQVSSKKSWPYVVDSTWVATQYQQSLDCVIDEHRKGCLCEDAVNYDPQAQEPADLCVGCMDPIATNYCSSAKSQGNAACLYKACTKWCYAEYPLTWQDTLGMFPGFTRGRDSILLDTSLCLTDVCGCLDPCAASYDSVKVAQGIHLRNPQPDTCQIVCGCLDSLAVNYAKRTFPLWAKEKFYRPEVQKHNQSVCVYTACKDSCALNFDPLDNPKIIPDGSCICEEISKIQLEKKITAIEWIQADQSNSVNNLTEDFFATNPNIKRNGKTKVVFARKGNDLQISVDVKKMKRGNKETTEVIDKRSGIPLGDYNFTEVNEVIDALLRFMIKKNKDLSGKTMNVFIVGEADGHPIGDDGIVFSNADRPIIGEAFRSIDASVGTDVQDISSPNFNLAPDQPPFSIQEGAVFKDNLILAFIRAYMVKQKIVDVLLNDIEEATVLIGAKANTAKGGQYRKVTTIFTIFGFYIAPEDPALLSDVDQEYIELLEAFDLFEMNGYPDGRFVNGVPTGQQRYPECPCYE